MPQRGARNSKAFLSFWCLFVYATLLIVLVPALSRSQQVSNRGLDAQRLSQIGTRMKALVNDGTIVGAVTLVARQGKVFSLEAVGFQDRESRRPMRTNSIFDVRSVTKVVTAIGVMILVEEGKLSLNDPVAKYLPDFKTTHSITIHHLLTHTSGLPFSRPAEIEDITIKRDRTLADVVALLAKQEPEYAPGTQFRYSSSGFAILGRIIEVVAGKSYEQFIKERVFDPLGMRDSFFFIPAEKRERMASVYRRQEGKLEKWNELEEYTKGAKYSAPEFGMYSTAEDLGSLCQMMLNEGTFRGRRILSRLSVVAMTSNHTLNIRSAITQRPVHQGLGWGLSGDPLNDFPLTTPGSYGHNGAFGSIIWIDPQEGLIRIFLEHLFGSGNEVDVFMAMAGAAVVD
jgi:CubicO group peptidase (beta-lactamase class C family)